MPYRSPARFLAPLALLAAVLTVFLVARPELGGSPDESAETSSATTTTTTSTPRKKPSSRRAKAAPKAAPKVYTVKPGDVLGSISESTGIPVADLLEFNGLDDAQSLRVGQELKLGP